MRIFFIVSLVVSFSFVAGAQEQSEGADTAQSDYKNYIGLGAGITSGLGLSYRRWFEKSGFQVNILPYYTQDTYDNEDTGRRDGYSRNVYLSLGLSYLRQFQDFEKVRFLGFASAHWVYTSDDDDYRLSTGVPTGEPRIDDQRIDNVEQSNTFLVGLGPEFEIYIWRFALNLGFGLAARYRPSPESFGIWPAVEGSIHYRF